MFEAILSTLAGGALRAVPEIMAFFDKKNERKHELEMFNKQLEADKIKGQQAIEAAKIQDQIAIDTGGLQALVESVKAQAQLTGNKFVDGLNALVRPSLTYAFAVAYFIAKVHSGWTYTAFDQEVLSGIIGFWFMGRVFDKMKR